MPGQISRESRDLNICQKSLRSVVREPLLHFMLVAAGLFIANAVLQGDVRDVVVVNQTTINYLVSTQEELLQRPLTVDEQQALVDNHIEEEILVREARKLGFEENTRIRKLLVQNMRFFLVESMPEPTEELLRAHFDAHRARLARTTEDTYETVGPWVLADWERVTSRKAIETAVADMKAAYRIEVTGESAAE